MLNAEKDLEFRVWHLSFAIRHLSLSLGLGEEMLRRMACGTLLCAMAALAGCGDKITAPTETPAPITETFAGTLNPASTSVHAFLTLTGGPVTATLTTI